MPNALLTNCPKCNEEIPPNIPKCPNCKAEFLWGDEVDDWKDTTHCPDCDFEIQAFVPECSNCGAVYDWSDQKKALAEFIKIKTVQQQQVMKFKCPNCQTILSGRPSHCPGCGVPFAW